MPGFAAKPAQGIPRTIWALGLVSLFMDASSELVHSLLRLFLVGTLGASMLTLGLTEGLAEASACPAVTFARATAGQFAVRQQSCLCCIFGPMLQQQPS